MIKPRKTRVTAFDLTDEERAAIADLAQKTELSENGVIRQALRLYQLVHFRLAAGERMFFSGDEQRMTEFSGLPSPSAVVD